jgi:hypothetical protein
MSKVNLITQAEYAKRRGCSGAAVSHAVKAGRISLIDGKIDPTAADAQWAKNSRVRAGTGKAKAPVADGDTAGDDASQPGADDYWKSRSRREAAEAELAEIELAEKNGSVIQVKAVEAVWAQAMGATREHLLQIRARLAPLLASETDPFKVEQLLEEEHSRALQLLAGGDFGKVEP